MATQIPPPPRLTGDKNADFQSLIDFLWSWYSAIVTEQAFVQNSDVGTSVQPSDPTLTALAGLQTAADTIPYFTGADIAALTAFTTFARTFVAVVSPSAARNVLGLGTLATANGVATGDIDDDAVTNDKLAKMAASTIKGNDTAGLTDPQDLSVAEVKTLLGYVIQRVYFAPSALSVVTGTLSAGAYTDLAAPGGTTVVITEVSGTPGFDVQVTFANVVNPVGFAWYGNYNGSASHIVAVEAWNYTTSAWDKYALEPNGTTANHQSVLYGRASDYVSAGAAKIRFNHTSSGVPGHTLNLDYCAVLGLAAN